MEAEISPASTREPIPRAVWLSAVIHLGVLTTGALYMYLAGLEGTFPNFFDLLSSILAFYLVSLIPFSFFIRNQPKSGRALLAYFGTGIGLQFLLLLFGIYLNSFLLGFGQLVEKRVNVAEIREWAQSQPAGVRDFNGKDHSLPPSLLNLDDIQPIQKNGPWIMFAKAPQESDGFLIRLTWGVGRLPNYGIVITSDHNPPLDSRFAMRVNGNIYVFLDPT